MGLRRQFRPFWVSSKTCDQSENNEIENIRNEKCDGNLFLFSLVLLKFTGSKKTMKLVFYGKIKINHLPDTVGQFNFYFKKKLFILPKMKWVK